MLQMCHPQIHTSISYEYELKKRSIKTAMGTPQKQESSSTLT
jgi:hypothetical protein